MAIYLGNTLLTGGGGGGGGGGILNVQEFTSSGSFNPAAAGLSVGDKIIVEAVSGGGGGVSMNGIPAENMSGGCGGNYKSATYTLTSTSAITVTAGAGGTKNTATSGSSAVAGAGGTTNVSGSGVSLTLTGGPGGASNQYSVLIATSKGPHFAAVISDANDDAGHSTSAGPGVLGYGVGGGVWNSSYASAGGAWGGSGTNPGCGGRSGGGSGNSSNGVAGMVKIYY